MASEWRCEPISGDMILFAPDRVRRPHAKSDQIDWTLPADDPFAEGQEHQTPGEVFALREPGTAANTPGWLVRVVPNKFPALSPGSATSSPAGVEFASHPASGVHEVIIECPQRESHLTRRPIEQTRNVLLAYRTRMQSLRDEKSVRHAFVFKNHGRFAGASLLHAHSQLMGFPFVPPMVLKGLDYAQQSTGDAFTKLIQKELEDGLRVVRTSPQFVVFCPFASRFPYEMWLLPRRRSSHFEQTNNSDLFELADVLRDVLLRLEAVTGDAAYNFVLHSAPFGEEHPNYRWQIRILPRITGLAGLELGGGTHVNLVLPEDAAAELRSDGATM
ncbi:galactose-1-phosphate uridylyltransferase [Thalassoroseus pseudoceratinae]|uniref:galactose-1-phosphate uridylyltransferase n=1 Tax=Thalassoroseus pseudoceratinae TaxID=2713176 RepID=UPI00141D96B8|nr:DUF4931 domain-containing protein [Thalassoroseus pseudoceratinae]